MGRSSGKAPKYSTQELELAYGPVYDERKAPRKSAEITFAYPKSFSDALSSCTSDDVVPTDYHVDFRRHFEMFLRKLKDKNTETSFDLRLKHEQRISFATLAGRVGKTGAVDKLGARFLSMLGDRWFNTPPHRPVTKWDYDDFLEGFDRTEALISHLKELANIPGLKDTPIREAIGVSDESCKAVRKDLVISAYNWVVEQLDVALGEFKEFRDGMNVKERKKYDKIVGKQIQTWYEHSVFEIGTFEEVSDIIKDTQKEMDDIIAQKQKEMDDTTARFNNQKKDVDSLVELIEGKQLGAIPKKKKARNSKSKKKNRDLQFKDASRQAENTSEEIIKFGSPQSKEFSSPQTEELSRPQPVESAEHFKSEASFIDIHVKPDKEKASLPFNAKTDDELKKALEAHVKPDKEKASLPFNAKMDDELKKALVALNTMKAQLEETENHLRKEQSKNSSAFQENNLLRAQLLRNDFMKYRDALRRRQKNNFSVIENLRSSPNSAHMPEVQLALRSLHEFSARLMLAEEQLSLQYKTLCQQAQTNNNIQQLQFDMADAEPPELGSSCMNLLYRSLLMSQSPIPTVPPPKTYLSSNPPPFESCLAASQTRGRTQSSQAKGSISSMSTVGSHGTGSSNSRQGTFSTNSHQGTFYGDSRQGTLPSNSRQGTFSSNSLQGNLRGFGSQGIGKASILSRQATGSLGSYPSNGAAATLNANPRSGQVKDCASSKISNKIANKKVVCFVERGGASINSEDDSCSICFEDMWESNSFYLRSCQHRFHRACIKQWLESPRGVSSTCPMWRF